MIWVFLVSTSILIVVWLRWRYKHRRMLRMAKKLPGPPTLPGLGNALLFMCRPEELITVIKEMTYEYGDLLRFWLGPDLNIVVSDPDYLKVLLTSTKTIAKGPQYKYMAAILGGGILSGSGPSWRKHRKIANPNYGKRAVESYSELFNKEVDILLDKLRLVPCGQQFDIYKYIVQTTSYAVCQTLMGLTREQTLAVPHIQTIIDFTPRNYDIVFDRMTKWHLQIDPVFWLTKGYKDQDEFNTLIQDFSKRIITHRLETIKNLGEQSKIDLMNCEEDTLKNTELSVIDRFILSNELHESELVDETFTIFTSSQEATAKISSFLLLMMAYHPECQEKLYNEIKMVIGDEDRAVTNDDFKRMPYLEMVFKEVIRLFPIGAMLQRTLMEDIVVGSHKLPAGCSIVAPVYHLHRDPRFWKNPEDFDPERFSPEITKLRNPCSYIPFSLGPMDCLGRYFAAILVKTICVRILREFKLTSFETYKDLRVIISISVASVNGFNLILTPRKV